MVQKTIDALVSGADALTTINIAHRLSTVRNSDNIFVMKAGKLVEEGSHESLMTEEGVYSTLVKTQQEAHCLDDGKHVRRQDSESVKGSESVAMPLRSCSTVSIKSSPADEKNADTIENERIKSIAKTYKTPWLRLFTFNSGEMWAYIPGVLAAALYGSAMPAFAFLLGDAMKAMYSVEDLEELGRLVNKNALMFVIVGVVVMVFSTVQSGSFSFIQGHFVKRVRHRLFAKFMEEDIEFHDDPENTPGKLTAALQSYAEKMSAFTGNCMSVNVQAITSLVLGMVVAFLASPELTGLLFATVPVLVIAGMLEFAVYLGVNARTSDDSKQARVMASEALLNLRTVRAMGGEQEVITRYSSYLIKPLNVAARKNVLVQ